ncbi:MAG: methylated-DNA--[protein]-cysteine S-methyltransferase, partial [Clostridia bacterium]|nr:methylated-DNA--[protein]-cysteine S-methyltransferase [Clostridia bacterium]
EGSAGNRSRERGIMEYFCYYDSPLGRITLAGDGKALTGLWFDGQKYYGEGVNPDDCETCAGSSGADDQTSSVDGFGTDELKNNVDGAGADRKVKPLPVFEQVVRWLDEYFAGKQPDFTPPLLMRGTRFRRDVWEILLTIPYGKTVTYGEIADRISKRRGGGRVSAQAIGGAVAHNPISLIVPCHRVIGADGSLTGYAGGLDRKARLLELEGAR